MCIYIYTHYIYLYIYIYTPPKNNTKTPSPRGLRRLRAGQPSHGPEEGPAPSGGHTLQLPTQRCAEERAAVASDRRTADGFGAMDLQASICGFVPWKKTEIFPVVIHSL